MSQYIKNVTTLRLEVQTCTGCGMCITVCPHAVLAVDSGKARIVDRDRCMECGACARNCPVGAIFVSAGVGCATGLINTAFGIKGECCSTPRNSCSPDQGDKTA